MGVFSLRKLLVVSVLIALLAYLTYTPYPEDVEHRAVRTAVVTVFRLMLNVARFGEYLGFGCYIVTARKMTKAAFTIMPRNDNKRIEVITDTMVGVEVLIFRPKASTGLRAGLIHLHGGGWTMLDPEIYRDVCLELAEQTEAVVVSVNYRKAPEHVFPAAIDDSIKVTKYFLRNAEKYGVDPEKVGIAGDSAGGNLAMATALHLAVAKDVSVPTLKLQGMFYPGLQAFDFNLPSHVTYKDGPGVLRKRLMIDYNILYLFGDRMHFDAFANNQHTSPALKTSKYASYVSTTLLPESSQQEVTSPQRLDFGNETLSKEVEGLILNPLFSPLMATDEDLALLPPTYLLIPELDVLRDDGFLAAARLRNVKVPVTVSHEKTEDHSFMSAIQFENSRKAIERFADYYKKIMTSL